MREHTRLVLLSAGLLVLPLLPLASAAEDEARAIQAGSRVSIEYTLSLDDGTTADTNVGAAPLVYTQGDKKILPALEQQLVGMKAGDSKQVTLSVEEGYGPVRPDLEKEIDTERIPEDGRQVGAMLMSETPSGQPVLVRVKEVKGDKILLDLNHPLAGQKLHFDVKVVDVE